MDIVSIVSPNQTWLEYTLHDQSNYLCLLFVFAFLCVCEQMCVRYLQSAACEL